MKGSQTMRKIMSSASRAPAPAPLARVLIIEDARDIARMVQLHLREANFEADMAFDGPEGLKQALAHRYDVVVLDIMLPGMDGLEICRRLRSLPDYTLIIMLTSKGTELDRVLGLELGADDYLTKPFSLRELIARIKALLRRTEALHPAELNPNPDCAPAHRAAEMGVIRQGGLVIETEKRKVVIDESEIALTAKEFDLLHLFACHPGRVYTRAQLMDTLWGFGYEGYEHTVNSHINRLRAKIEKDPAKPRYLLTVWGVGYKFADAES